MRAALVLVIPLCLAACKKADDSKPAPAPVASPAPAAAKTAPSDGPRHVAIEANKEGYVPPRITGKPNEKLVLDVTRTIDADCLAQLVAPDKKTYELPLNKQVAIPVTVPAAGELTFACGMDMFHGTIVAQP